MSSLDLFDNVSKRAVWHHWNCPDQVSWFQCWSLLCCKLSSLRHMQEVQDCLPITRFTNDHSQQRERSYLQKILDKLSSENIFLDGAGYLQNFETSYWLYSENRQAKSYHSSYLQKSNWSNSMNQAIFRKFLIGISRKWWHTIFRNPDVVKQK